MDIRPITDTYAVAPQIDPADCPAIAERGFTTLVCNRPDSEIGPEQSSEAMRAAAEAAGLDFVMNPIVGGSMGPDQVDEQARALAASKGPVLAYCRSGTRSCFVWAFGAAETVAVDDIVARAGEAGYDLAPARTQLDAIADAKRPG